MTLLIPCGCGHDLDQHENPPPDEQMRAAWDAFEGAQDRGADEDFALDRAYDAAWAMARPCKVLDCPCIQFVALPLPAGTYIHTGIGADGMEVVSHAPMGPARRCSDCRRPIGVDQERYTVVYFAKLQDDEAAIREGMDDKFGMEWMDAEVEGDELRTHFDADLRGVPTTMCVTCTLDAASIDGEFDQEDENG